jgi:hypothetical protein
MNMFYLFYLNLFYLVKEYNIFEGELLHGALQIPSGVDTITDI